MFNSALHTPNLSANLILIGHFDDTGCTIIFAGKTVRFINPDGINILTGGQSQGMYLLETVESHTAMITKSINKPTMLNIWHRRFGHAGISGLCELARKNLVDGLDIIKGEPLPGSCEDCIYGKHTTCPYDADVEAKHKVLRRVHVDIWGKAHVKSIRGAFYLMLFTDGGSSYRKKYYLSDKSGDTLIKCIKAYHVKSECQTGEKLKCFRFDQAFCTELIKEYCQENGIVIKGTTPYAHASNGVAEKSNRQLLREYDAHCQTATYLRVFGLTWRIIKLTPGTCYPHLDTQTVYQLKNGHGKDKMCHTFDCLYAQHMPKYRGKLIHQRSTVPQSNMS